MENEFALHRPVIFLVGCKSDAEDSGARKVQEQEARRFAEQRNINFFETSAKTGYHVEDLFSTLTQEVNIT